MGGTTARKMTYRDWLAIPKDGFRHEIIEGDWFMSPAPGTPHQQVSMKLSILLGKFILERALGSFFAAPVDVVLSDEDVVEPDLVFVSSVRASILTEKNILGAPDLVIEVLSPTTASVDRGRKRDLYERHGVREYWIVDPDSRTVQIHEFVERRRVRSYRDIDSFASDLFPGLTIRAAEIFG